MPFPTIGTLFGAMTQAQAPSDQVVPSVLETLARVEPSSFSVTQFLDGLPSVNVTNVYPYWFEIGRYPRYVQINGATTAGTANTAKTITIDDIGAVKVGDILVSFANATNTTLQYIVVTKNSATSIDLQALPQDTTGTAPLTAVNFGTVPAFADNEVLYWIGNSKSEADSVSDAITMYPAKRWNYVQTVEQNLETSDHAMRQANYGPQNWQRTLGEGAYEFRKSREANFVFSTEPAVFQKSNNRGNTALYHKMGGCYGFIDGSLTLSSSAGISDINGLIYDAFANNSGSRTRLLIGGSTLMQTIDDSGVSQIDLNQEETVRGVTVLNLRGRTGTLGAVYHPLFDEFGIADEGLILDPTMMYRLVYQEVERRNRNLKESSDGIDAEGEYLIVKESLALMNATGENRCHWKVTVS